MSTILEAFYERLLPAKEKTWNQICYTIPSSIYRLSRKKQKEKLAEDTSEKLKAFFVYAYGVDQFKTCAIIKEILEERECAVHQ